jgi:6-methylsalicylate decarboxylase
LLRRVCRHRPDSVGTDFPDEDGDTFVRAVDYISESAGGQAQAILETNAMALFRFGD